MHESHLRGYATTSGGVSNSANCCSPQREDPEESGRPQGLDAVHQGALSSPRRGEGKAEEQQKPDGSRPSRNTRLGPEAGQEAGGQHHGHDERAAGDDGGPWASGGTGLRAPSGGSRRVRRRSSGSRRTWRRPLRWRRVALVCAGAVRARAREAHPGNGSRRRAHNLVTRRRRSLAGSR